MSALACRPGRSLTAFLAVALVAVALAAGAEPARADIGIESVDRTSGVPGDRVELLVYCGGCLPRTVRLPILLLPVGDSPRHHPCRGTSCAPRAPAPPTSAPYVPLGTATTVDGGARLARRLGLKIPDSVRRQGRGAVRDYVASTNRLRFRIPDAEPGLYTYVIFCCGLSPAGGGDLIGHPQRRGDRNESRVAHALRDGEFLRIRRDAARTDGSRDLPHPFAAAVGGLDLIAALFRGLGFAF